MFTTHSLPKRETAVSLASAAANEYMQAGIGRNTCHICEWSVTCLQRACMNMQMCACIHMHIHIYRYHNHIFAGRVYVSIRERVMHVWFCACIYIILQHARSKGDRAITLTMLALLNNFNEHRSARIYIYIYLHPLHMRACMHVHNAQLYTTKESHWRLSICMCACMHVMDIDWCLYLRVHR